MNGMLTSGMSYWDKEAKKTERPHISFPTFFPPVSVGHFQHVYNMR
jgi:hypothetical protein